MKTTKGLFVVLLLPGLLWAQSDVDALRYALWTPFGTARFMGLAGAYNAVGADFSSLSRNPAGLGLFRSDEVTLTPALSSVQNQILFQDQAAKENALPFQIMSGGVVLSKDLTAKRSEMMWKYLNFGFGINGLAEYNAERFFSGYNSANSLIDYYVAQANQGGGVPPSQITDQYPFGAGLFYQTYLIDPLPTDTLSYSGVVQGGNVQQEVWMNERGGVSEFVVSVGGNYNDRLLLGFTLGLPVIDFESSTHFTETDVNNIHDKFNNFSYVNRFVTIASGINAKMGFTYQFPVGVRLGMAVHTPTYFWLKDEYFGTLSSHLGAGETHSWTSPLGIYHYDLVTPWSFLWGASVVKANVGMLTADFEWTDYGNMYFRFRRPPDMDDLNRERELNQLINEKYRGVATVRLGGEWVFDVFRFRGGMAFSTSPFHADFVDSDNYDQARWTFSGGVGFRGRSPFFADMALVWSRSKSFYQPYTLAQQFVPGASITQSSTTVAATLGYRF